MAITGIGISFYCGVGFGDEPKAKPQPIKQKSKYHDVGYAQPFDYSFGTSPSSSAGTLSGRNSPTRGGWFVPTPPVPAPYVKPESELTDKERQDRDFSCRMWGAPWRPVYDDLLAAWRKEMGKE